MGETLPWITRRRHCGGGEDAEALPLDLGAATVEKFGGRNRMRATKKILSFAEYAATRHPTPYVVEIGGGDSRLVVFGGRHSSEPGDPMFAQIEAAFLRLAPLFALHEGTPPQVEPEREVAIRRHGEAGLLCHLAARAGIATASLDIPLPEEARRLRREMPVGEALVYLVVRQLASFNRKTARMDFRGYFEEFFALIAPGLEISAITWPLVEREHRRVMGYALIPGEVSAWQSDPMGDELPTQRISRLSNRLRDEHILCRLLASRERGARVFATLGVSHAVMLEAALRAGWEAV